MDGDALRQRHGSTMALLHDIAHHPEETIQEFSREPKQRARLAPEDDVLAREMEDILAEVQCFSSASPVFVTDLEAMIRCWRDVGLKLDLTDLRPNIVRRARSHRNSAFLSDLMMRVKAGLDARVRLDLDRGAVAALQATLKPVDGAPCLTWRSIEILKPILRRAAEIWKEDASSLSGGSSCSDAAIWAPVIQKRCRFPWTTHLIRTPRSEDTPNAAYFAAIAYVRANLPAAVVDDVKFDCGTWSE
jgi:hypothetical protein